MEGEVLNLLKSKLTKLIHYDFHFFGRIESSLFENFV